MFNAFICKGMCKYGTCRDGRINNFVKDESPYKTNSSGFY